MLCCCDSCFDDVVGVDVDVDFAFDCVVCCCDALVGFDGIDGIDGHVGFISVRLQLVNVYLFRCVENCVFGYVF